MALYRVTVSALADDDSIHQEDLEITATDEDEAKNKAIELVGRWGRDIKVSQTVVIKQELP